MTICRQQYWLQLISAWRRWHVRVLVVTCWIRRALKSDPHPHASSHANGIGFRFHQRTPGTPCTPAFVFVDSLQDGFFLSRQRRVNGDGDGDEDPAHCPNLCGRFYRGVYRKSNLRRHLFECGVLPRYPCSLCDKRFFRRYQLRMHLIVVHKWMSRWSRPVERRQHRRRVPTTSILKQLSKLCRKRKENSYLLL